MPIYNPGSDFRPGSGYGPRKSPTPGGSTNHRGQDFPAVIGTSIPAAADGIVYGTYAKKKNGSYVLDGYGNTIVIEHTINGEKVYTLYAHLNEPSTLKKGDRVSQGDCVGYVGVTGNTSGPHLHFEVIKDQPNPIGKGHATYDPRTFEFPDASGSRLGGASADSDRDSTGSNSHGTGAAGGPGAGGASVSKR
ncbi:M23 family metallopeptidase, partial [Xylella fastidiosa subsp. fastidiosa]